MFDAQTHQTLYMFAIPFTMESNICIHEMYLDHRSEEIQHHVRQKIYINDIIIESHHHHHQFRCYENVVKTFLFVRVFIFVG